MTGIFRERGDVLNKWDYYTPLVNVLSVCACVGDALTVLSESLEYCNFCPQFVCYVWFEVWQRHSGQKYYKNKYYIKSTSVVLVLNSIACIKGEKGIEMINTA